MLRRLGRRQDGFLRDAGLISGQYGGGETGWSFALNQAVLPRKSSCCSGEPCAASNNLVLWGSCNESSQGSTAKCSRLLSGRFRDSHYVSNVATYVRTPLLAFGPARIER